MAAGGPPDMRTVLGQVQKLKITKAINIFFNDDGTISVSIQRGKQMAFYGKTGEPGEHLADVLTKAIANGNSGDIEKALKLGPYADEEPDTVDDGLDNIEPEPEDDDDDFSVI